MKEKPLLMWISANALGLGVGFVAALYTLRLIEFGFDTEVYWKSGASGPGGLVYYASKLVSLLVLGAWARPRH